MILLLIKMIYHERNVNLFKKILLNKEIEYSE